MSIRSQNYEKLLVTEINYIKEILNLKDINIIVQDYTTA